jgi:hypothetical protein
LAEVPKNQLAGKIGVVIDIITRLPVEIWFQEKATASDMKFESDILKLVKPQTLILLEGLATDPIKYFAAPENRDLGIVKSIRKPFKKLIIDPFPERVSREGLFFFEPSAQPCLTTVLAP